MKKMCFIFLLIATLIFLVVCGVSNSNDYEIVKTDYTFAGENDLWTATYQVTGETVFNSDNLSEFSGHYYYVLTVTYKNDVSDLFHVKNINISCLSKLRHLIYTDSFPEEGQIQKSYILDSNSASMDVIEDEIIKVTITLDNDIQELELKNKAVN